MRWEERALRFSFALRRLYRLHCPSAADPLGQLKPKLNPAEIAAHLAQLRHEHSGSWRPRTAVVLVLDLPLWRLPGLSGGSVVPASGANTLGARFVGSVVVGLKPSGRIGADHERIPSIRQQPRAIQFFQEEGLHAEILCTPNQYPPTTGTWKGGRRAGYRGPILPQTCHATSAPLAGSRFIRLRVPTGIPPQLKSPLSL